MNFKLEREFVACGYHCLVVGTPMGHRCGYVGIPIQHSFYGVDYDDIDIEVHGGLTFGDILDSHSSRGFEVGLYYLGFDCGHLDDGYDIELIKELRGEEAARVFESTNSGHVWTTSEVETEVRRLAAQLKQFGGEK